MSERDKVEQAGTTEAGETPRCPICGKPRMPDYRPFCSKRCADLDLGRWLKGGYAIPATPDDDEDGDELSAAIDGASGAEDRSRWEH